MAGELPTNQARFTFDDVVAITGGRARNVSAEPIVGISTDTRFLTPANAFVALRGPTFDGHDYVETARKRGASVVIVEEGFAESTAPKSGVIYVADTTRALGLLGQAHRRRWSAQAAGAARTVIAVAGSVGKTTTRRAIATLLGHLGARVHYAKGNFNNAIGIPLVLLGLDDTYDTAVVEIGTSRPGEVAYGTFLTAPDIGVLTLVAMEHGEGLGDLDAIAREEGDLLAGLGSNGIAVVNGDDPRCTAQLFRSPARTWLLYGKQNTVDVRIALRSSNGLRGSRLVLALRPGQADLPAGSDDREPTLTIETPLLGEAGAYATAAAVTVATVQSRDLTAERITAALAPLAEERDAGRLVPRQLRDGLVLLDDSYNANGASAIAGIEAAQEIAHHFGRRLVLVLGEMRELGRFAAAEHDAVAAMVLRTRPTKVIAVHGDAARIATQAKAGGIEAVFAHDVAAALPHVRATLQPGDVVLVKGSRGVGLDALVQAIAAEHDPLP